MSVAQFRDQSASRLAEPAYDHRFGLRLPFSWEFALALLKTAIGGPLLVGRRFCRAWSPHQITRP